MPRCNHSHRAETSITGNWRFTFTFKDGQAYVLDYEDYRYWLCTILPIPASLLSKPSWSPIV